MQILYPDIMTYGCGIIYLINICLRISFVKCIKQRCVQSDRIPFHFRHIAVIGHIYILCLPFHRRIRIPVSVSTVPYCFQPRFRSRILHTNKISCFVETCICHTKTIISRHHFLCSDIRMVTSRTIPPVMRRAVSHQN